MLGRDRDGQQLRCPNLVGNRLIIGRQACDMDLDGLHRSLPAFVDRAATGEASRQGRDGYEVAAAILGSTTIVYVRIEFILSQRRPQFLHGDARLAQDRAEQAGPNRLPRVQRHSHPATAAGVLKLRMRPFLDDNHPAVLAERSLQFPAGDPGQWRMEPTVDGRCDSQPGQLDSPPSAASTKPCPRTGRSSQRCSGRLIYVSSVGRSTPIRGRVRAPGVLHRSGHPGSSQAQRQLSAGQRRRPRACRRRNEAG